MSNTIPPLVSSTPPPIEFDDSFDDGFETIDSEETSLPSTPRDFPKTPDTHLPVLLSSPFTEGK